MSELKGTRYRTTSGGPSPLDLTRLPLPARVMPIEEAHVLHAAQAQQRARQPRARAVPAIEHKARGCWQPRDERAPERQVDGARHVPGVELRARAHVDHDEPAAKRALLFELIRRHIQSPASSMTIRHRPSFFVKNAR